VAWLLEKKHQKHILKWTGTTQHPSHNRILFGNVLTSFVHFLYEYSQNTVLMADIPSNYNYFFINLTVAQCILSHCGWFKHFLFDMMFHTTQGDSGAGYYGQDGIDEYIEVHKCVNCCRLLGLKGLGSDFDEEEEEES
ncbi:hypothetical protein J3R30DRAFT_3291401, partial [Lentinula aciculospora]